MKKTIIFIALLLLSSFSLFAQHFTREQEQKLTRTLLAVSNLYVDSINTEKLIDNTIIAVLEELDPHSNYIPKDEVKRMSEPLDGSFEGVGIQFQMLEDTLLVVQVIAGGPSERVGILPGDRIVYIEEELVAGVKMMNTDISKRLRGAKGTMVSVKIARRNVAELIEFKITRDKIPIYSVDATYMISNDIGYVKINNFGRTTIEEFRASLLKLKEKGMKDLVLDLQGNGGGYLRAAIDITDEFLKNDKLIVYTEGLNQPKSVSEATSVGDFEKGRLVVLIDEYSASASEIVSGAIQDWDRGVLVGRRTFGKGLVQRELPLGDGSVIRLTTARYYTPTGRSIQKPYKGGSEKYTKELLTRFEHGELQHRDSIRFSDSLQYETLQLHRTVYGGGGIMPDVFIPVDTARFTDYHRKIVAKGVLNKTVMHFIDDNRDALKRDYTDFETFKKNYAVDEAVMKNLIENAESENITLNEEQYERSKALIQLQMKALIARDLWEMNEYYQIMAVENESLKKAVEILETKGAYNEILKPQKKKTK
ncbi:MAG: S41 family peptidase [Prevotellaceae bacterium]|jgi:carboxyl-terminal processing protease|nr:S41 family peptidase [Prevotellaceae bacterium]